MQEGKQRQPTKKLLPIWLCFVKSPVMRSKTYPASAFQQAVLTLGMAHGTYFQQWVFQVDSEMDQISLRKA